MFSIIWKSSNFNVFQCRSMYFCFLFLPPNVLRTCVFVCYYIPHTSFGCFPVYKSSSDLRFINVARIVDVGRLNSSSNSISPGSHVRASSWGSSLPVGYKGACNKKTLKKLHIMIELFLKYVYYLIFITFWGKYLSHLAFYWIHNLHFQHKLALVWQCM